VLTERRSRGRRGGGGEIMVREVVREAGGGGRVLGSWPTLTKTILMSVKLQALHYS
jgi:hypothetical protein